MISKWVAARLQSAGGRTNATGGAAGAAGGMTEPAVFAQYCAEVLQLAGGSAACDALRAIALGSAEAVSPPPSMLHPHGLPSDMTALIRLGFRCDQKVLQMHYCTAYDAKLQPPGRGGIPTNNWMRDDCLGGSRQLKPVFDGLRALPGGEKTRDLLLMVISVRVTGYYSTVVA